VSVALRYEHYFSLNLAFLGELLRVGRLAELECLNDGDTKIAFADRLGQPGEHGRVRLDAKGLDSNIYSFCRFGFPQDRPQDSSWLQLLAAYQRVYPQDRWPGPDAPALIAALRVGPHAEYKSRLTSPCLSVRLLRRVVYNAACTRYDPSQPVRCKMQGDACKSQPGKQEY
jgi:hypothetical protein